LEMGRPGWMISVSAIGWWWKECKGCRVTFCFLVLSSGSVTVPIPVQLESFTTIWNFCIIRYEQHASTQYAHPLHSKPFDEFLLACCLYPIIQKFQMVTKLSRRTGIGTFQFRHTGMPMLYNKRNWSIQTVRVGIWLRNTLFCAIGQFNMRCRLPQRGRANV
jgi:hypothetical protein